MEVYVLKALGVGFDDEMTVGVYSSIQKAEKAWSDFISDGADQYVMCITSHVVDRPIHSGQ